MKKLITNYVFDASEKTINSPEFTDIKKIALITNVTSNIILYNFADPTKSGVLSGDVLTLVFDTTAMSDSDDLQIILHAGTDIDRIGFAKAISNDVDGEFFSLLVTGAGQTVNQTAGNLVLTAGTTVRSETIIRSNSGYIGGLRMRIQNLLSQRIANQQFFVELVDVVGDGLTYTINSATSITVTIPNNKFTSANVGQSVSIGNFSGTGTFLSGRYVIASVSGDDVNFTVSGFAVGTGTCALFGWNFYRLEYSGVTATSVLFDTGRKGYASGNTTATINTTASPGHQAIITGNDGIATLHDQLVASTTVIQTLNRASSVVMVPDDMKLYLQIRIVNGGTAPATNTTWTIGQISVGSFEAESVIVQDMRPTGFQTAMPVEILRQVVSPTQPISGAVTLDGGTLACPVLVADVASAAITTTATTAAFTPTNGSSYQVNIPVTVATGTTPSMVVEIEESDDSGTNWFNRYTFPPITATGIYRSPILKLRGNRIRYVQTITGTSPSFTRAINRVIRQFTEVAGTPWKLISAATTNATSVKPTPCEVTHISVSNNNASARYLKIYDKASAPTVGTDIPTQTHIIPGASAGGGSNLVINFPINFNLGFAFAITGGIADADTTAIGANEVVVNYNVA